jgi:hypothetical protein
MDDPFPGKALLSIRRDLVRIATVFFNMFTFRWVDDFIQKKTST